MKKMLMMCLVFGSPLYAKPLTYKVAIHNKLNEPIILQEWGPFHIKKGTHEIGAGQDFEFGLQFGRDCDVRFKRKVEKKTIDGYGREHTGEYYERVNCELNVYSDYDIEADSNNKDRIKVKRRGNVRQLSR